MAAHRYWRINITDNNHASDDTAGLMELQMHAGTNGFGVDQCESGTPSADTEFSVNFVASNGFDGDLVDATGNSWASTSSAFPHWLRYDFGSGNDKDILGISVVARGVNTAAMQQAPRDFSVQYSDDGSAWTTAWSQASITWSLYETKYFRASSAAGYSGSPHGSHSHWRLLVLENDGGANVSATEVEMRATPGGADQTSGGTAAADTTFSTFVAGNAFDGSNSTFWANNGGATSWLRYSFAAPVEVAQVTVRSRQDSAANQAPKTFAVQFADSSAGPWTTAWMQLGFTGWALGETKTSSDPNYIAPPVIAPLASHHRRMQKAA